MLSFLLASGYCRDSTNLYASQQGTGDCFNTDCSFNEAMLTLRTADVIRIKDKTIYPPSYPSEWSDLIEGAVQSNVTIMSHDGNTVIDGKFMTGGVMYYLENQRRFTWGKFVGFTFRNFNKLIMSRQHSWSLFPQVVFQDCNFEDCTSDLFSTSGGVWVFINCNFKNIKGKPFKALSESVVEFVDCTFEDTYSLFGYGCDFMFRNCIFKNTNGQRGGAIYASKSTLYVNKCKFINTHAQYYGGAIYIRDSREVYESEISDSCFYQTQAKNGTAIYGYLSFLDVHGNTFSTLNDKQQTVFNFGEDIKLNKNSFGGDAERCIREHEPLDEPDLYFPCDTYQRHETDDAHGNIYLDFSNPDDPLEEIIN
jgi:hypothetical protein